jgi:hypothetical protein
VPSCAQDWSAGARWAPTSVTESPIESSTWPNFTLVEVVSLWVKSIPQSARPKPSEARPTATPTVEPKQY